MKLRDKSSSPVPTPHPHTCGVQVIIVGQSHSFDPSCQLLYRKPNRPAEKILTKTDSWIWLVFGSKIDGCELTGIKVRFITIFVYKMLLPGGRRRRWRRCCSPGGGCELIILTGQSVRIPVTRYEITILE